MSKRYVVLGGGTAGAMAALYMEAITSHRREDVEVLLIKSEDIGIIGAGEGTTPLFLTLMRSLGVSVTDIVNHTGATIKNGIKFTNWRGGGEHDSYMHPFYTHSGIGIQDMFDEAQILSYPGAFAHNYVQGESPDKSDLTSKASKLGKALFSQHGDSFLDESANEDPIKLFKALSEYALHFDGQVMGNFLTELASVRGVQIVEGKVVDFAQSKDGNVTSLKLEDGKEIKCDFVIDASGMKRFFPKAFESEWVSWKDHLKTDTAITFFGQPTKKLDAYTEAIAMENGWMWKIPLQHRVGYGYVFDSSLTSPEEAKAEVEAFLGREIEVNQTLTFEPGYYKEIWKHNVVSVGLSSSFVEPLEATSIWATVIQLETLFSRPEMMDAPTDKARDFYNYEMSLVQEDIASLIYFHYMGRRKEDSTFWSRFTRDNAPEKLKELLDIMDWRTIDQMDMPKSLWALESWYYIAFGINYKPLLNSIKSSTLSNVYIPASADRYLQLKKQQHEVAVSVLVDHRTFLEKLGAPPWDEI